MKGKFKWSFIILTLICALFGLCSCDNGNLPEEDPSTPPSSDKTVWEYSIDEFAQYLYDCGDIYTVDYHIIGGDATVARDYDGLYIYWWDVDNLLKGTTPYKTWNDLQQNEGIYFLNLGKYESVTSNGPFAVGTNQYSGDLDKVASDVAAFPCDPTERKEEPDHELKYGTHDYNYTYPNYGRMVASYPNASYEYEINPIELPTAYTLRNDYMVYTQAQGAEGLCWDFASALALSTTYMRGTGEYLDFSEAWIAAAIYEESKNGTLDNYGFIPQGLKSAGHFLGFDFAANRNGVVLEQDFSYGDVFLMNETNHTRFYNYYKQFASYDIMKEVAAVRFENYLLRSDGELIKKSMKSHILNEGAITAQTMSAGFRTANVNGKTITYKSPKNANSDHVIAIIGWDDAFTVTEDGVTYTGAWICLNSWGNATHDDGVFYIPYEDDYVRLGGMGGTFWAYSYVGNDKKGIYFADTVKESSANYITDKKGAYYGDFSAESNPTKQKNIFYGDHDVDITYKYDISAGAAVDNIDIYLNGNCVTDMFTLTHDSSDKTLHIAGENVIGGAYKVDIMYSSGENKKRYFNAFYVCDGTEYDTLGLSGSEYNALDNLLFDRYYSFGNSQDDIVYYTSNDTGFINYYLPFAAYNRINSVQGIDGVSVTYMPSSTSAGIYINYDLGGLDSATYSITISTTDGVSKTIDFIVMRAAQTDTVVKMTYNLNGGKNSEKNYYKMIVSDDTIKLNAAQRNGYVFAGWYYDANLTDAVTFDGQNYLVDSAKITFTGTFGNAFLYAKWEKI